MSYLFEILLAQTSSSNFNPVVAIFVALFIIVGFSILAFKKAPNNKNIGTSSTPANEIETYFKDIENKDSLKVHQSDKLIDSSIVDILKIIGWIYFTISLIGSIILWANASEYPDALFALMVAFGIACILSSLIVISICLGIARIIEQNIYLINSRKL